MAVGREEGLRNAGRYAMDNMRVEFGLATMGNEYGPHMSPLEVGLTRAIDFSKVRHVHVCNGYTYQYSSVVI